MDAGGILSLALGGGLAATLTALLGLKSSLRKSRAEAAKSAEDAEAVRLDNAEHATRILSDHIVKPLKEELYETRKYLEAAKREMARLRKSIDMANGCRHRDDCPVLGSLREQAAGDGCGGHAGGVAARQRLAAVADGDGGGGAGGGGHA